MCGIVGIIGNKPAADRMITGLRRLEYRGYDSAGISVLDQGRITTIKETGKLDNLARLVAQMAPTGHTAIGHTRWATHGAPTKENAHPHTSGPVSLVHNGIIENFAELRAELDALGYPAKTQTDTEIVALLLHRYLDTGLSVFDAFFQTLGRLRGAFSLGVLIEGHDILLAARRGSPLAIGYGDGENYIGSDSIALAPMTDRVTFLNDGDWAVLTANEVTIYDALGVRVNREMRIINTDHMLVDKGRYRHFMAKEIHDQSSILSYVLSNYLDENREIDLPQIKGLDFKRIDQIRLVACGTAYLACFTAKYWLEDWAGVPVDVEVASEFRYRKPRLSTRTLVVFVSQSGETADTLAALVYAKSQNARTLALVNSEESSIAREAEMVLPLKAGPELSVASTKAFTAQLLVLSLFSASVAVKRGERDHEFLISHRDMLMSLPRLVTDVLKLEPAIHEVARTLSHAHDVLFLGRGALYPLALEAALKFKEITYIHAEGYASGELKHGPIALVDENLPVVSFIPNDRLVEKSISNIKEVEARGAHLYLFTDQEGAKQIGEGATLVVLPQVPEALAPIVYAIPAQLLAYHAATEKGTDVDQPRNLAKSVTVE